MGFYSGLSPTPLKKETVDGNFYTEEVDGFPGICTRSDVLPVVDNRRKIRLLFLFQKIEEDGVETERIGCFLF